MGRVRPAKSLTPTTQRLQTFVFISLLSHYLIVFPKIAKETFQQHDNMISERTACLYCRISLHCCLPAIYVCVSQYANNRSTGFTVLITEVEARATRPGIALRQVELVVKWPLFPRDNVLEAKTRLAIKVGLVEVTVSGSQSHTYTTHALIGSTTKHSKLIFFLNFRKKK